MEGHAEVGFGLVKASESAPGIGCPGQREIVAADLEARHLTREHRPHRRHCQMERREGVGEDLSLRGEGLHVRGRRLRPVDARAIGAQSVGDDQDDAFGAGVRLTLGRAPGDAQAEREAEDGGKAPTSKAPFFRRTRSVRASHGPTLAGAEAFRAHTANFRQSIAATLHRRLQPPTVFRLAYRFQPNRLRLRRTER